MKRGSEFWQYCCRNFNKSMREKEKKVGERECMNFINVITEIFAARSTCPSVCIVCSKWDVLKKKNCGNALLKSL